jgi:hypothetical protein
VQDSIFDRDLSFELGSSDAVGYSHTEGGHDVGDFAADPASVFGVGRVRARKVRPIITL